MRAALAASARSKGLDSVPFIWFWPDGADACVLMTHDVEGERGAAFCSNLMDLDEWHDIKAAFQIIPASGRNSRSLIAQIRDRGFEVNLHDLNHDGYLFEDRDAFLERAMVINRYAEELGCRGFRSAAMYRNQRWFDMFEFSYDMSVPSVAHLEPQRGGCCSVMPYFVGGLLELPLTTVQDYSLFHILEDYSIALWRTQCERILAYNGLITFITHPDYLAKPRAEAVYRDLLEYLNTLRLERNIWMTSPGEVDRWWRNRQQMRLVMGADANWRIEGPDSGRARIAYARIENEEVVYELGSNAAPGPELANRAESRCRLR
jgi:peptidoglycan/xylan/chitin deacetylase (PgdA/CDA1 family)